MATGCQGVSPASKKMMSLSSITFFFFKFIYFWLRWVFVAARGLSLVAANGGYSSLWCSIFSCCGAQAVGAQALVVVERRF